MAPLAIFWFIIAFYLQAQELRLTTEELANQVKETGELVKHQAEVVKLMEEEKRRSIEKDRPRFIWQNGNQNVRNGEVVYRINFINSGGIATDLKLNSGSSSRVTIDPQALINAGVPCYIDIYFGPITPNFPIEVEYEFLDGSGNRFHFKTELHANDEIDRPNFFSMDHLVSPDSETK